MIVQARIAEYIKNMGIRQSVLCEKTGIDKNAMSGILNGKRKLTVDEFEKLCIAIEKNPNSFMDFENDETIQ